MTFFIGLYKLHRSITLPLLIVLRCTCARCERICSLVGDDETLPLRWGFARIGRKFDEEARNACIKGDASAHTQALWLHESCGGVYGSGPRNSKRENLGETKDQGFSCLILPALCVPLELVKAVMDFQERLRAGFLAAFITLDAP
ncbi:hypothetical protein YC2023_045270 [Brassica napus]